MTKNRNRVFLALMSLYIVLILLEVVAHIRLVPHRAYFYMFFVTLVVFFGFFPLYSSRRLTAYYGRRVIKHRPALFGFGFIFLLVLLALFGPLFTQSPTAVNFKEKNMPPVGMSIEQSTYDLNTGKFATQQVPGTWGHPLGTDENGRDLLAMIVSGARISLEVGLLATGIAIMLGTIIGVASAYLGGWVDNVLMRFTDIVMTFPFFLVLVFIVFIFGPNLMLIITMIGLTGWTGTARLVRSEALSLRTRDFILASRALGASDTRIIFRHLIPNALGSVIVIATLSIPGVILAESALSFIGLGDPMVTSWGRILNAGQNTLDSAWWVAVEPGVMLFLTVLAFNFVGDALRDSFDPRSEL